ncbi:hypothetical protein ACN9TC_12830 [Lactococcus lactis]|nr:hypothetical protein [Lactococcus lactis]
MHYIPKYSRERRNERIEKTQTQVEWIYEFLSAVFNGLAEN